MPDDHLFELQYLAREFGWTRFEEELKHVIRRTTHTLPHEGKVDIKIREDFAAGLLIIFFLIIGLYSLHKFIS
jgi:hypothetical protein